MEKRLFDDLIESVKQAGAIRRGEAKPSRKFHHDPAEVRGLRLSLHMSQAKFASVIKVSKRTLQNWEQGRRSPTGPAWALLKIVSSNPKGTLKLLEK